MITVTINGKRLKAEEGMTLLEVAREYGIYIPTLCYHEALKPYGACRLCVVEVTQSSQVSIETSCTYPVLEGLKVKTDTEKVKKVRRLVMELLLARCPNPKELKALGKEMGVEEAPLRMSLKNEFCILCGQCVRACHEVVGAGAISFTKRGSEKKVDTPFHETSEACIGCGACVFICPTGVIKMRDVMDATFYYPQGHDDLGPMRMMQNWQKELKLKECKVCGNPYAPEFLLETLGKRVNLPKDAFDLCPGCREVKK
jgi:predicted molibdopterin-dependent oxidoreductase YjgC